MSNESIERIENLIRVVSSIPDQDFDIIKCRDCALGHATRDAYFIARGFDPNFATYAGIMDFFEISAERTRDLFYWSAGYESRRDVISALRVLLLEKMAHIVDETCASMGVPLRPDAKVVELEVM